MKCENYLVHVLGIGDQNRMGDTRWKFATNWMGEKFKCNFLFVRTHERFFQWTMNVMRNLMWRIVRWTCFNCQWASFFLGSMVGWRKCRDCYGKTWYTSTIVYFWSVYGKAVSRLYTGEQRYFSLEFAECFQKSMFVLDRSSWKFSCEI